MNTSVFGFERKSTFKIQRTSVVTKLRWKHWTFTSIYRCLHTWVPI